MDMVMDMDTHILIMILTMILTIILTINTIRYKSFALGVKLSPCSKEVCDKKNGFPICWLLKKVLSLRCFIVSFFQLKKDIIILTCFFDELFYLEGRTCGLGYL